MVILNDFSLLVMLYSERDEQIDYIFVNYIIEVFIQS